MENTLLVINCVLTGLLAGVFYAYSVSVNGALKQLKDIEYIRAMQAINRVIQNPLFFICFMGPLVTLPWVTALAHGEPQFWLLLVATCVYYIGSFGLTVTGNVPLNERLDKISSTQSTPEQLAAARRTYETPWVTLHTIRTLASILAFVLLVVAIV